MPLGGFQGFRARFGSYQKLLANAVWSQIVETFNFALSLDCLVDKVWKILPAVRLLCTDVRSMLPAACLQGAEDVLSRAYFPQLGQDHLRNVAGGLCGA